MNDVILEKFSPHVDILFSAVIADALDAIGHHDMALPPDIRPLDPHKKIFGRIATLKAVAVDQIPARPYAVEMECIDRLQPGEVLVATTSGERRSALWGELLSTACRARGAVGVVLDGLTRDAAKILSMGFPVFAAGFSPLDSKGRIDGVAHGVSLQIGSVCVQPGDYVFGDIDGVVVIPRKAAESALTAALEKVRGENRVREELAAGESVQDVFSRYGIL